MSLAVSAFTAHNSPKMDLSEAVFWDPLPSLAETRKAMILAIYGPVKSILMFSRRWARNYDSSVRCLFDCAVIGFSYKGLPKTGVDIYKLAI